MKILGIETSSKVCAVALSENDKLIKEKILEDENTHSVKLMPLVDELLKETKTELKDIDLFSCDKGPGSFTGIRIGIATVKAFLDATNKKAVGVSSLEILAYNSTNDGIICSIIDARNNNVYCGFFERKDNIIKQIGELKFDTIKNVLEESKKMKSKITFIGDASKSYKEQIVETMGKQAIFETEVANKLNARNINLISYIKRDEAVDTNKLLPDYLRKSNAERQKK